MLQWSIQERLAISYGYAHDGLYYSLMQCAIGGLRFETIILQGKGKIVGPDIRPRQLPRQ